jgi:hypothetical protein
VSSVDQSPLISNYIVVCNYSTSLWWMGIDLLYAVTGGEGYKEYYHFECFATSIQRGHIRTSTVFKWPI